MSSSEADPLPSRPVQPSGWQETNHRVAGRERAVVLRAALNAAVVAAILSLIPFASIVGMPLGGFLAVLFYKRRSWRAEPSLAGGFRLGALTGLLASAILGIVLTAGVLTSNHGPEFQQQLIQRIQTMENRYPDPDQRQAIQQMVEYLKTQQGMTTAVILGAILVAVIFVVLSGLGGMISASLLRRKGPRG